MSACAPLSQLRELQERYGLFLYIDDAHGISLYGERGGGFARSVFDDLGDRTIVAASLGKGFGASGGTLMLGTATQELLFRRFSVAYAFSASLNTAAIGAARASASIHRTAELGSRQAGLRRNLALLDRLLPSDGGPSDLPIRTVRFGDELAAVHASRALLEKGYFTSAIFFPTVARGEAGLRICLSANHEEVDIRGLCDAIGDIRGEILRSA